MNTNIKREASPVYTVTFTAKGHASDELKATLENILFNIGVSPESWRNATTIATLELMRSAIKGKMLDLNMLAWILYEAGRLEALKEQTNQRRTTEKRSAQDGKKSE